MTGIGIMLWFVSAAIVWTASPVAAMMMLGWMSIDWATQDYVAMKKKTWKTNIQSLPAILLLPRKRTRKTKYSRFPLKT